MGSERKQKEIRELSAKNNIDVVAGQEFCEKEDTGINVKGYKWVGKPHSNQNGQRGEGRVVFLVRKCLVSEDEFITSVMYEENVWMTVRGDQLLYIGCVYMPTDGASVAVAESCCGRLKEDLEKRDRWCCLVILMAELVGL